MKTLKDRFVNLLPAFPPQHFNEEEAEKFIGDALEHYIDLARFYEQEIRNILIFYHRTRHGMTKEDKIKEIRKLITD